MNDLFNEEKKIDYPTAHPKEKEIEALKADIDKEYKSVLDLQADSRMHYQKAMESLKAMGEMHKLIHEGFHILTEKFKKLQEIIESPTI